MTEMLLAPTIRTRVLTLSCFLIVILLSVVQAAPQWFAAECDGYSLYQKEYDEPLLQTTRPVPQSAAASFTVQFDTSILHNHQPCNDISLQTLLSEVLVAPPPFITYDHASSATHQIFFNILSPQGWRMISLSVYGDMSNQNYAVVWVKPAVAQPWYAIHGATGAQYQAFFNKCASLNFHPILLSAAGDGAQTVFAGTCEAQPGPIPLTRFGLISGAVADVNTIEHWNKEAHTRGWILTSGAIYGTLANPRFAGIWSNNVAGVDWSSGVEDTSAEYQARFNTAVSAGYRPSFVTLSSYGRYLSVFVNNTIGPWIARHGLSETQYQSEYNLRTSQGFYPFVLQGGGFGDRALFAVLFAKNPV